MASQSELNQARVGRKTTNQVNLVFILSLLIGVPLVYLALGKDWINRIGIILNFCAGFMLAPELLGTQRLKATEQLAEQIVSNALMRFTGWKSEIKSVYFFAFGETNFGIMLRIFSFISLGLSIIGPVAIISSLTIRDDSNNTALKTIGALALIMPAIMVISYTCARPLLIKLKYSGVKLILILPFALGIYYIIFPLTLKILPSVNRNLSQFLNRLTGEEKLRSILIWWGIVFFIVGNILQFSSTFDFSQTQQAQPASIVTPTKIVTQP